jgi:hypothetical protein
MNMKFEACKEIKECNSDTEFNVAIKKGYEPVALKMRRIKTDAVEETKPIYIVGKK